MATISPSQPLGTSRDEEADSRFDDREPHTIPVPILSIQPGNSPRLNGEDKAHVARLAETEAELPPILVDRRTMQVIDGMHRLMAASLQGRETIKVIFFYGSEADMFLRAVEENVAHGLPLSQADRRAAAERIIQSHPQLSDRAIARSTGLAARTVAADRRRLSDELPQLNARIGRDGKTRPLDIGDRRRRAAKILAEQPESSLRDVARAVGISPATVLDVRKRLERGEPPVLVRSHPRHIARSIAAEDIPSPRAGDGSGADTGTAPRDPRHRVPPAATVEKLMRDPSLRNSEGGRRILRLLHMTATAGDQMPDMSAAVPPHCVHMVTEVAHQYAQMWQSFATELGRRGRVIDPAGQH